MQKFSEAEVVKKVREIIFDGLELEKNGKIKSPSEIPQSVNFKELGADSLDSIEIAVEAGRAFEVKIPDGKASRLRSIDSIVSAFRKLGVIIDPA